MSALLEIAGLRLTLPAAGVARTILRDVALEIESETVVGLVGESGSGKSMTARAITRVLPSGASVTGAIHFDGRDVLAMGPAELRAYRAHDIAMIFQDPRAHINPVRRIGDSLIEILRHTRGMAAGPAAQLGVSLLADVLIDDPERRMRQYPHELSGGMLQRVMIAAALGSEARLFIADEATTALDVTTQAEVIAILDEQRHERGLAVLFITHDLDLAAAICDRISVMYAGEIVESGVTAELTTTPSHPYCAALLGARPELRGPVRRLEAIPGRPRAAFEVESGCAFADRCRYTQPACMSETIALTSTALDGYVRCRRADELSDHLNSATSRGSTAPSETDVVRDVRQPEGEDRMSARAGSDVLEVSNLRKVFRARRGLSRSASQQHLAVDDVSFSVSPGASLGIVGESGSGKTTLARIIVGLERATAGTVRTPTATAVAAGRGRRQQSVQIVFQDPYGSLDPHQSIRSCLTEAWAFHHAGSPQRRASAVAELAELVGLDERVLGAIPRDLSGGQRQRVAIARALAAEPAVLVLDEAVSALDVSLQAVIVNQLTDLRKKTGIAYVLISHDLAVIRQVTEEVIVMKRGKVVERGKTEAVLREPQHEYTRLLLESVPRRGWKPRRGLDEAVAPQPARP